MIEQKRNLFIIEDWKLFQSCDSSHGIHQLLSDVFIRARIEDVPCLRIELDHINMLSCIELETFLETGRRLSLRILASDHPDASKILEELSRFVQRAADARSGSDPVHLAHRSFFRIFSMFFLDTLLNAWDNITQTVLDSMDGECDDIDMILQYRRQLTELGLIICGLPDERVFRRFSVWVNHSSISVKRLGIVMFRGWSGAAMTQLLQRELENCPTGGPWDDYRRLIQSRLNQLSSQSCD